MTTHHTFSLYETVLYSAGWEPVTVVLFSFLFLHISETRWVSPHSGKVHKLHKALKKEVKARQQEEVLFV